MKEAAITPGYVCVSQEPPELGAGSGELGAGLRRGLWGSRACQWINPGFKLAL